MLVRVFIYVKNDDKEKLEPHDMHAMLYIHVMCVYTSYMYINVCVCVYIVNFTHFVCAWFFWGGRGGGDVTCGICRYATK